MHIKFTGNSLYRERRVERVSESGMTVPKHLYAVKFPNENSLREDVAEPEFFSWFPELKPFVEHFGLIEELVVKTRKGNLYIFGAEEVS